MKAKIIQAKTLQAKIQDTKTINAIMRWGLVIHENIELSKEWEYIVWRTVGKLEWKRLIPISELKVKWDKGDRWEKGYIPQKWVDYFDWYTPKKWIDYFDWNNWKNWKDGNNGKDWLSAFELWKLEDWNKNKSVQDFWNWLRREWEHIVMAWSLNVVPTGWSLWQVLKKKSSADFDLEWGTWWGGWSWIVETIVPWANMSVDNTDPANPIVSVENLVLADITDVTATVTELNYVDWVTSAIQTQLDWKVDENWAITWATKTKITYDAKWLVTSWADATTADIADSSNKRYVTDAQQTVIGNTSWTNTGDNAVNTLYSWLVTNATHTGEMNGSWALTADPTLVSNKTLKSSLAGTEEVLINDAWTLKKTTAQDIADLGGGGWSQPYTALSSDTTITQGNVYWVTASTVDITLTLTDGTSAWQTLTVKKLDSTDYSVFINNTNIDWETSIELTIEDESVDLYRTGTTFIIK